METSLTVVTKSIGQEPNMKMIDILDMKIIDDILGVVMIFGMGYAALVMF